jgi:hypothetical protein
MDRQRVSLLRAPPKNHQKILILKITETVPVIVHFLPNPLFCLQERFIATDYRQIIVYAL